MSVLLVEGPSEARWQLGAALRHEGYGVVEAKDSVELRDYLDSGLGVASQDGLPDLLIVDTDFVGKPGVEVLIELRRTYRHIPVILLSKSFNREAVRKAGALDAAYLFQEPSDTETVVLAALSLLDPGERKRRATPLRWLGWHQGAH